MKFFVPKVSEDDQEKIYQALKEYNARTSQRKITDRRIYRLHQKVNRYKRYAETTKPQWLESDIIIGQTDDKETLLALFETVEGWFLMVTKSNGGLQGAPKWVPADYISDIEEFDSTK